MLKLLLVLYLSGTIHGLSSIFMNNKIMKYNEKGELVELDSESVNKKDDVKSTKSLIKTSENVNAKQDDSSTSYLNELLSKYNKFNFTYTVKKSPEYIYPQSNNPSNNYLNYIITKHDFYNKKPTFQPSKPMIEFAMPTTIPTPTPTPPKTTLFYNNQKDYYTNNSYANILNYEPVKSALQNLPSHAKQVVIIYATPPPTTSTTTKKPKKRKPMTEEDFLENLNFFRKYFNFNCTLTRMPAHESSAGALKRIQQRTTTIRPVLTTVRSIPKTTQTTTAKPKIKRKTVYVNPPVVGEIEGVMESVYDFMESALTDKEVVGRNKNKTKSAKNKVKAKTTSRTTKISQRSKTRRSNNKKKKTTTKSRRQNQKAKNQKRKSKRQKRSIRDLNEILKFSKNSSTPEKLDHSKLHPHHTLKFKSHHKQKRETSANLWGPPPSNPQSQYGVPATQPPPPQYGPPSMTPPIVQYGPYPASISPQTQKPPDLTIPNPLDIGGLLGLIPNPLDLIGSLSGPQPQADQGGGLLSLLPNPLSLLPNPLKHIEDKFKMEEYHVHDHHYVYPGEEAKHVPAQPAAPPNILLDTFKALMMMFTQVLFGLGDHFGLGAPGHHRRVRRDTGEDEDSYYYDSYEDRDTKGNGTSDESEDEDDDASESQSDDKDSTSTSEENSEENDIMALRRKPVVLNNLPTVTPLPVPAQTLPTPEKPEKKLKKKTQRPKRHNRPEKKEPLNKDDSPPWYYPTYFFVETSAPLDNEIDPIVTPPMALKDATTESSWFGNWFSDDDSDESEEKTSRPPEDSEEDNSPGWFGGIFGDSSGESITTTKTPTPDSSEVDEPLFNFKPNKWLSKIAQQFAKVTAPEHPVIETFKPRKIYYDNHQLWRLYPKSKDHVSYLEEYMRTSEGESIQWWKGPSLFGLTDALVPSDIILNFKKYLKNEGISYEIVIRDVQKAIYYSNPKASKREILDAQIINGHPVTFYRYHPHKDIQKFLEVTERQYPRNVELIHIGSTFEGRPITVVKISSSNIVNSTFSSNLKNDKFMKSKNKKVNVEKKGRKTKKRAVLIEAGSVAREWLPVASSLWMIDYLAKNIDKEDSIGESMRAIDWYILPVLNIDGYEYSYKYDRLWKKSRSEYDPTSNSGFLSSAFSWLRSDDPDEPKKWCFGVDMNRNWDFDWGEEGTSFDRCNQNYGGKHAFSELETKALSKFIMQHRKDIKLFISLHSYGQTISYSNVKESLFSNQRYDDLMDMAMTAVESLRSTGSLTKYVIDSQNDLSFKQSGTSDHFAKHVAGIKYSYKIELRDTGVHGFLLPANHIESSASEAFQIIKGMVDYL